MELTGNNRLLERVRLSKKAGVTESKTVHVLGNKQPFTITLMDGKPKMKRVKK